MYRVLYQTEFTWEYFWTVFKRCAIHGDITITHMALDHLELFEYSDKKVKRIPNVLFVKRSR